MKKMLTCLMTVAVVGLFFGCQKTNDGKCIVEGVVNGEQYEGKRVFLVPLMGPATAETVDSMEITNGKFHFEPDSLQMYKVLLDYHYRLGLETVLLVGEPGTIKVVLDSVSHATGTPQNDSLDHWKALTEIHNHQMLLMGKTIQDLTGKGDTVQAASMKQRADSFHLVYKNSTRALAENLKEGPLHEFLKGLYPLTYKRKYPDGRIVLMNADTNEEIEEVKN